MKILAATMIAFILSSPAYALCPTGQSLEQEADTAFSWWQFHENNADRWASMANYWYDKYKTHLNSCPNFGFGCPTCDYYLQKTAYYTALELQSRSNATFWRIMFVVAQNEFIYHKILCPEC